MANTFGPRVWRLDTPGAVTTDSLRPATLEWAADSATDTLVLQDAAGNTVLTLVANALDVSVDPRVFPDGVRWDGLTVATIDGGTVEIHLR